MAGDALEMATVKRALSGVDVVIQSLGVSAGPEIIFEQTRLFSKATRVLVTAMEETQVKRLICVTGFGAGDSRGRGGFLYNVAFHLLLARVYDDKDVQEWIIRRSKLDWVIVRPVILTDGPTTNAYRALVDPRDWTCGFISRADVADFLVKRIDDDAFLHKTPVLTSSLPTSGVSPHCRRAAEQRDELAPPHHSITSSARASTVGGISRSSALAVLRLMTRSNLVGCTTGKLAGFSPLRILPT
jgi:putative NADH-flavin reductase